MEERETEDWAFRKLGPEAGVPLVQGYDSVPQAAVNLFSISGGDESVAVFAAAGADEVVIGKVAALYDALINGSKPVLTHIAVSNPLYLQILSNGSQVAVYNQQNELALYGVDGSKQWSTTIEGITQLLAHPVDGTLVYVSAGRAFSLTNSKIKELGAATHFCFFPLGHFARGNTHSVSFGVKTIALPQDGELAHLSAMGDNILAVVVTDGEYNAFFYTCARWIQITDACPPFGDDSRFLEWYTGSIENWIRSEPLIIVAAASQSTDMVMATYQAVLSPEEDADRASMPFTDEDTSPVGGAMFTGTKTAPPKTFEGAEESSPMPLWFVLTNEGAVTAWAVVSREALKSGAVPSAKKISGPLLSPSFQISQDSREEASVGNTAADIAEKKTERVCDAAASNPDVSLGLSGMSFGDKGAEKPSSGFSLGGQSKPSEPEKSSPFGAPSAFGGTSLPGSTSAFGGQSTFGGKSSFGASESTFGKVQSSFGSSWGSGGSFASGTSETKPAMKFDFAVPSSSKPVLTSNPTIGEVKTSASLALSQPQESSQSPFGLMKSQGKSPFGLAVDSKSPFGTAADSKSPFGASADSKSPFGASADSKSPFGASADSKSPFGAPADSKSPFGAYADSKLPFGATSDTKSPSGGLPQTKSIFEGSNASPFGTVSQVGSANSTSLVSDTGAPKSIFGSTSAQNQSPFSAPVFGKPFGAPAEPDAKPLFGSRAGSDKPFSGSAPSGDSTLKLSPAGTESRMMASSFKDKEPAKADSDSSANPATDAVLETAPENTIGSGSEAAPDSNDSLSQDDAEPASNPAPVSEADRDHTEPIIVEPISDKETSGLSPAVSGSLEDLSVALEDVASSAPGSAETSPKPEPLRNVTDARKRELSGSSDLDEEDEDEDEDDSGLISASDEDVYSEESDVGTEDEITAAPAHEQQVHDPSGIKDESVEEIVTPSIDSEPFIDPNEITFAEFPPEDEVLLDFAAPGSEGLSSDLDITYTETNKLFQVLDYNLKILENLTARVTVSDANAATGDGENQTLPNLLDYERWSLENAANLQAVLRPLAKDAAVQKIEQSKLDEVAKLRQSIEEGFVEMNEVSETLMLLRLQLSAVSQRSRALPIAAARLQQAMRDKYEKVTSELNQVEGKILDAKARKQPPTIAGLSLALDVLETQTSNAAARVENLFESSRLSTVSGDISAYSASILGLSGSGDYDDVFVDQQRQRKFASRVGSELRRRRIE